MVVFPPPVSILAGSPFLLLRRAKIENTRRVYTVYYGQLINGAVVRVSKRPRTRVLVAAVREKPATLSLLVPSKQTKIARGTRFTTVWRVNILTRGFVKQSYRSAILHCARIC